MGYFFKKGGKKESKWERDELFYETIKPAEQTNKKLNNIAELQSEIALWNCPTFPKTVDFFQLVKIAFPKSENQTFWEEQSLLQCSSVLCRQSDEIICDFWSVLLSFIPLGQDLIHDSCRCHFSKQHSWELHDRSHDENTICHIFSQNQSPLFDVLRWE